MAGLAAHGCGQCVPCRINRRRLWAHRLLLESYLHADSCFVTLTYSDDKLPAGGSLVPEHVQGFLKRLRARVHPVQIRFFAVGEYGELSGRAHYHLALFGLPLSVETEELVASCWGHGLVHLGQLNEASASYVARYVVKKWTRADDPRLCGRRPEFCRMSLRPGIGARAMGQVASHLADGPGRELVRVDVPRTLLFGRRGLLLGRYLRGKLREALGWSMDTPPAAKAAWLAELQGMLEEAGSYQKYREQVGSPDRCLQAEVRSSLRDRKGSI